MFQRRTGDVAGPSPHTLCLCLLGGSLNVANILIATTLFSTLSLFSLRAPLLLYRPYAPAAGTRRRSTRHTVSLRMPSNAARSRCRRSSNVWAPK